MTGRSRLLTGIVGLVGIAAVALALSAASQAAFPGANGPIAFNAYVSGAGEEIWIMNAQGSDRQLLTPTASDNSSNPSFSPSGRQITYTSEQNGHSNVFIMNTDGSHQVDITHSSHNEGFPSFSPDGTKIVFDRVTRSGLDRIFVTDTNGSHQRQLTAEGGSLTENDPSFSPDGKQILFERGSDKTGQWKIYIMDTNGSHRRSLGAGFEPSFSPNGQTIVYASHTEKLFYMSATGSHIRPVNCGNVCGFGDFTPQFSPDGRQLVFSHQTSSVIDLYTVKVNGSDLVNLSSRSIQGSDPNWGVKAP